MQQWYIVCSHVACSPTMKQQPFRSIIFRFIQVAFVLLLGACAAPPPPASKAPELPVFPPPPDEARFIYERTLYSSADVVKEDKNENLRRMLTGETTRSGEGFGKPYGVAVYQGRVFVSDSQRRSVAVFDIPGQRYFTIGDDELGKLVTPLGLDVDGKGNLYVVDAGAKQVQVYDKDGKHLRTLAGGGTSFVRPSGIAVNADGSRIYVVDTGGVGSDLHRVRVYDAQSGQHLLDIGKRGTAPGEFNLPCDATIGLDGLLYVVDCGNFRVQVFRPDGTFERTFGAIGRQGGQFARPKEAAIDQEGNVYIVDAAFGNFQIFNPQGQLLLTVGSRSERDGMAKYMLPAGIAIDGDGRVYLADQWFRKVDVYRPIKLAADAGFVFKSEAAVKK